MALTAVELGKKIQAKEVTVEEAVKAAIASIKAKEEKTVQDFDRYIEIEKLLRSEQAKRSAISRKAYTETKSI